MNTVPWCIAEHSHYVMYDHGLNHHLICLCNFYKMLVYVRPNFSVRSKQIEIWKHTHTSIYLKSIICCTFINWRSYHFIRGGQPFEKKVGDHLDNPIMKMRKSLYFHHLMKTRNTLNACIATILHPGDRKGGLLMWYLGNRKHSPCFYWFKTFKRTRNAVGTWTDKRVFPKLVRVKPSFHTGFFLAIRLWASDFYRMIHDKGESTITR